MRRWRPAAGLIDRTLDAIPPASGAVVMGTGIVSITLSLDGQETISGVIRGLAAVFWVALAVLLPARAARDRTRFLTMSAPPQHVRRPLAVISGPGRRKPTARGSGKGSAA